MIISVVRAFNWTPETINSLYLDDADYFGLEFWYNDVVKVDRSLVTPIESDSIT